MLKNPQNLFLVGLMGAGKTTLGRVLAKRLGWRFVDSDHEIEARTGVKIPVIFEIEGEAGFRRRETAMIAALTDQSHIVLATGGGAVLAAENRQCLKERGVVVFLDVAPAALFERIRHDKGRPLLQSGDPLAKLNELYAQRYPLYREIADVVVDGTRASASKIIQILLNQLEHQWKKDAEPPRCA